MPTEPNTAPMFRLAVVALSGHPNGQRLIRLVAEVAKVHKAKLIGVHVVEIDWSMPLDMDVAGLSDEIQRRFFDWLDHPVERVSGREASPSISKKLERAAIAQADEVVAMLTAIAEA